MYTQRVSVWADVCRKREAKAELEDFPLLTTLNTELSSFARQDCTEQKAAEGFSVTLV